jgi:hypothetical protein
MPQAGVALGMALVGSSRMPELRHSALPIAVGTTVFFELIGPICPRFALVKVSRSIDDPTRNARMGVFAHWSFVRTHESRVAICFHFPAYTQLSAVNNAF